MIFEHTIWISNSNGLELIHIRPVQPKNTKLRPFLKPTSWVDPNPTSKRCYIVTFAILLHCYIATLLYFYICYIATFTTLLHLLHCYICYICYIDILLHCYIATCYIATLLTLELIQIRIRNPKATNTLSEFQTQTILNWTISDQSTPKLCPFSTATSWVDPNQTSKPQSYKATGDFRTHYLNFKLKPPGIDPDQISPTQSYEATPILKGNILSRSKSDFQTPKLQSYRHISNALPEFQTQTALNLSKSDQSNPKLRSYAHFGRQHLE